MFAWTKYELYKFIMQLTDVQLWRPYIYLVSRNTYEHMQHYLHSIQKPLCNTNSSPYDMNAILYYP